MSGAVGFLLFLSLVWYGMALVQSFMAYGTAYRHTKVGGDDGVSLFGWFIVFGLAALVPGLGIYLWKKSKELGIDISKTSNEISQSIDKKCKQCNKGFSESHVCPNCGSTSYELTNIDVSANANLIKCLSCFKVFSEEYKNCPYCNSTWLEK